MRRQSWDSSSTRFCFFYWWGEMYRVHSLLVGTSHLLLQMFLLVGSYSIPMCLHPTHGWSHLFYSSEHSNTMPIGKTDSIASHKNKKNIASWARREMHSQKCFAASKDQQSTLPGHHYPECTVGLTYCWVAETCSLQANLLSVFCP